MQLITSVKGLSFYRCNKLQYSYGMPTKHVVKTFAAPAFYHVYNRASGERPLFREEMDRSYFLTLLQKHLVENNQPEDDTKTYEIEIIAYCLMGSHFHLLLFQEQDPEAITGYMRSVSTAYSMYYNKKYKSKGHVFQSSYRASHITNEPYLAHITRYIHLNPRSYTSWEWSSYGDYVGKQTTDWIHPERVLEGKDAVDRYARFVADYAKTDRRLQYTEIGNQLAI
jgi:putative transposase